MYPETLSQNDILSWGDFIMISLLPDHLLYPKNCCCSFKVGLGEPWVFQSLTPEASGVLCGLGFVFLLA